MCVCGNQRAPHPLGKSHGRVHPFARPVVVERRAQRGRRTRVILGWWRLCNMGRRRRRSLRQLAAASPTPGARQRSRHKVTREWSCAVRRASRLIQALPTAGLNQLTRVGEGFWRFTLRPDGTSVLPSSRPSSPRGLWLISQRYPGAADTVDCGTGQRARRGAAAIIDGLVSAPPRIHVYSQFAQASSQGNARRRRTPS